MVDSELTPVLIAQAWQVTLLIVVVAAINRWVGKSRPHLAHALWLVVLVKCVTPPIWSSPSGLFCWLQPSREAIREPLAVEPSSRSWSDLLAAARSTELSDETELGDQVWSGSNTVADDSLLSFGDERIEEMPSPSITSEVDWLNGLLGLWISASLGVIGVAIVRWLRCWRMVRSAPQRDCAELSAQLDSLAKQLRLRCRVRLIVTESRIGPAVIGLFRTTVLLPALIVDRLSQRSPVAESSPVAPRQESRTSFDPHRLEALEGHSRDGIPVAERQGYGSLAPILAHELLHIRRGDLWVGLLQTLAQALWWCHPLVWWVNRRTTREAERCCDEEVLAELGCDPAAYARALIDVLELKRELKPVPVFPGVRPVEVTSQRLERIMQLGQGCQRRTPWWCWLLAGLAAATTWPGAAFVVTAEDPGERGGVSPPVFSPKPPNRGADATPLANESDGAIDLNNESKLGLAYRVRIIRGAEDDLRTLAQKFNEKLIAKPGDPVIVEHDELLRLLKEAQAFPLKLVSYPVATGRGRERVSIGDTATFSIPVEVTAADGTTTLYEQSREYGWRLTMQPSSIGIESLRLRVVNEQSRLNNDAAVKVRYRMTGEEKLIPGLDVQRTNTTVELKHAQHVVFPITKVPNADSQDVMLVMMQARLVFLDEALLQPEPTPMNVPEPSIRRGVGVNSDSGVIGEVVLEDADKTTQSNTPQPTPVGNKIELDGLGQLLWQHGSWFIVVRPEPGAKLVESVDAPATFESKGPVRVMMTQMQIEGFDRKNQLSISAEKFTLSTNENGQHMRLTGGGKMSGHEFDAAADRIQLTLVKSPDFEGHDISASLTGKVSLWRKSKGELWELSAEKAMFLVRGSSISQLGHDKNGVTAVLRQPPELDAKLVQSHQRFLEMTPVEKRISVHFDTVPLKAALQQLAKVSERNIHLDKAGLADEGLTDTALVTLNLDQVKLSSALNLLLDPLNLGYRVEESGVIVVTSQQRLKGQPLLATYAVADLATPVPKRVTVKLDADLRATGEASKPSDPAKPTILPIHELAELIMSTCQPDSWEEVGGTGRIKVNDTTLSLVVRQTREVHDEIRDLLGQLRRLQDLQAALHVETLTVPADFWSKVGKDLDLVETEDQKAEVPSLQWQFQLSPNGIPQLGVPNTYFHNQPNRQPPDKPAPQRVARLTKKEAALLRSLVRPESAPKVTLFNGQELEVFFGGESPTMRLALKPVVSADLKGMKLHAAATNPDAELDFVNLAPITLESGHSLLLDVTEVYSVGTAAGVPILSKVPGEARLFKNAGKSDQRTLLLVTGAVVIVEEEEVR